MPKRTAKPNIQIDDVVREMTAAEYAALVESGWTPDTVEPVEPVAE